MTEVPQTSPDPDLRLIQEIANGNRQALSQLYERHGRGILSYLLGQLSDQQLAEETLQDVMLAAWHGAETFRAESKVRTWLIGIARMKVLSIRRRQGRIPHAVELDEQLAATDTGVYQKVELLDDHAAVRTALVYLPVDQRETLELVFYQGLTGPEAADVLGVSPGTIKSRLHRAKNTLRGLLIQKEVGDGRA